jgi:hypothetical protein
MSWRIPFQEEKRMAGMASSCSRLRKGRIETYSKQFLGLAIALVCVWQISALQLFGQKANLRVGEGDSLPARTGEPLTVKPVDLPDVECTVVQWSETPKPVLTLLCPPMEVFAPLRIILKLSWLKPEDAPVKPSTISVVPGTLTKLHTNKTDASVWLSIKEEGKNQPQAKWVSFNGVADVALLPRTRTTK